MVVPASGHRLTFADSGLALTVDQMRSCQERYDGTVVGFDAQQLLDKLHFLSAGAVSFARGLNDTPKIVALLLVLKGVPSWVELGLVGTAMALGGWLASRRVAETMSRRITRMNHGQGFTANSITALLVIGASRLGLPVSTTHVSCGALFGIGAATGGAHWKTIAQILTAWVTTLPLAGLLGAAAYFLLVHKF